MSHDFSVRRAAAEDVATIARHRVGMFRDMGRIPSEEMDAELFATSEAALAAALEDGSYVGWLAVDGQGSVVAGVGAHIRPQLPRIAPGGRRVADTPVALVVNVYTEPSWRRRGIARVLMNELLRWAAQRGFDQVVLHASDAGRRLYDSLGFEPTNEMRWSPRASTE